MPPPNTPEEGALATASSEPSSPEPAPVPLTAPNSPSAIGFAEFKYIFITKLDYQAIEYVGEVDDTLLCPVCRTPFISPITTPCGHTFCRECIDRALETQSTCPIDRQRIRKTRDYHLCPLIIKEQLDRLMVKCPNKGCNHQCPREHLEGHYKRRCDFTLVQCTGPDCVKPITRRVARKRLGGCMHDEVDCRHCGDKVCSMELDSHYDNDCMGRVAVCSDCRQVMPNPSMTRHKHEDCPKVDAPCKWHSAGCRVFKRRELVKKHEAEGCSFEVISRMLQQQAEDRKRLDEMARHVARCEERHARREARRAARAQAHATAHGTNNNNDHRSIEATHSAAHSAEPSSDGDGDVGGSTEDYVLAQFERLESELEILRQQSRDMDARQSHIILQHAAHFSDQIAEIGSKVGVVNMHLSWLMSLQRQSRSSTAAAAIAGAAASVASGSSSGARPGSSDGSGWRYSGDDRRYSEGGRPESLHRL
ncbi:uncharacterized protein C8A04DRAFT_14277 [Dichotomopilus funicola]|uniref:Uncharacterized protein n=1 Tax=Dichotomopilus funicola TaxID=1934379 RepID=A0AAN6V0B1_9PEZI|nr:hypothetical protein C8A04DRAFT_14277 [Dichotomopilus funicola]